MALEQVDTRKDFVKYTSLKKGDVIVDGVYLETSTSKTYGKAEHHFKPLKGERTIVIPSAGQVDSFLEKNVERGMRVVIKYKGKEKIEKGVWAGKEANTFDFQLDRDYNFGKGLKPVEAKETTKPASKELDLDDLD
jgi:hypothetical protein